MDERIGSCWLSRKEHASYRSPTGDLQARPCRIGKSANDPIPSRWYCFGRYERSNRILVGAWESCANPKLENGGLRNLDQTKSPFAGFWRRVQSRGYRAHVAATRWEPDLQLNAKLSGKDASVGRDGFLDLFWKLDQIVAWARTRDPEAVRYAEFAPSCGKRHNTLEIDLFCNFATAEAKAAGGDIKEALWRASGWQKPNLLKERSVEILSPGVDVPLPFDAEREALMAQLEAEGKIRIIQGNDFPALDYLLHLFRLGRLVATGNVVGDPKAQEISTKDWAGLEVAEGGDDERLAVWRIGKVKTTGGGDFENVRVSRDNVLREFPSDLGELTTLELEAEPTRRKPTTQEDREADQRSAEQSRAMAARDFAEVFWPLEYALKWVALQRPERMHESLRAAILYNGGQPLAEGDFKGAILRALQEGRLHGVRDSKPLAPEFWAGVQPYALPAKVYLRREEMLALWPALAAANPSDDDARALNSRRGGRTRGFHRARRGRRNRAAEISRISEETRDGSC